VKQAMLFHRIPTQSLLSSIVKQAALFHTIPTRSLLSSVSTTTQIK